MVGPHKSYPEYYFNNGRRCKHFCLDCNIPFKSKRSLYSHLLTHIKQPSVELYRDPRVEPIKLTIKNSNAGFEVINTSSPGEPNTSSSTNEPEVTSQQSLEENQRKSPELENEDSDTDTELTLTYSPEASNTGSKDSSFDEQQSSDKENEDATKKSPVNQETTSIKENAIKSKANEMESSLDDIIPDITSELISTAVLKEMLLDNSHGTSITKVPETELTPPPDPVELPKIRIKSGLMQERNENFGQNTWNNSSADKDSINNLFNNNDRAKDLGFITTDIDNLSSSGQNSAIQPFRSTTATGTSSVTSNPLEAMSSMQQLVSCLQKPNNGLQQQNVLINIQQFPPAAPAPPPAYTVQMYPPPAPPMYPTYRMYQPPSQIYYPPAYNPSSQPVTLSQNPSNLQPHSQSYLHRPVFQQSPLLLQRLSTPTSQQFPQQNVGPTIPTSNTNTHTQNQQQMQSAQMPAQSHQQAKQNPHLIQTTQQGQQQLQYQQQMQAQAQAQQNQMQQQSRNPRPSLRPPPPSYVPSTARIYAPRQPRAARMPGPRPVPQLRPKGPLPRTARVAVRGAPILPKPGLQTSNPQMQISAVQNRRPSTDNLKPEIKRTKVDAVVPDKYDDADCQVVAVTPKNTGLPQIQSIQGNVADLPEVGVVELRESITLSRKNPTTKESAANAAKTSDASNVAGILATRGITVTQAAKTTARENESASQELEVSINLNDAVCIIPKKPDNPNNTMATVDLTDDKDAPPPSKKPCPASVKYRQNQVRKVLPFKCDWCPARYPDNNGLQRHKRTYHNSPSSPPSQPSPPKSKADAIYGIPIIDLSQPNATQKLLNLGINHFVPLPDSQQANSFALPILNVNQQTIGTNGDNIRNILTSLLSLGPIRTLNN